MPMTMLDERVAHGHRGDRRRELARRERHLLHDERQDPRDRERIGLPARQHRADPVVAEDLDRRLAQRRGEAVQDAGARAVQRRLPDERALVRRARAARPRQRRTRGPRSPTRARARCRCRPPPSPTTVKIASPSTTTAAPRTSRRLIDLVRQEVAEREREHDRRHEQRLDHREPAVRERDRLERVARQGARPCPASHHVCFARFSSDFGEPSDTPSCPRAPFCCSVAASAKKNAATSARISATAREPTPGSPDCRNDAPPRRGSCNVRSCRAAGEAVLRSRRPRHPTKGRMSEHARPPRLVGGRATPGRRDGVDRRRRAAHPRRRRGRGARRTPSSRRR